MSDQKERDEDIPQQSQPKSSSPHVKFASNVRSRSVDSVLAVFTSSSATQSVPPKQPSPATDSTTLIPHSNNTHFEPISNPTIPNQHTTNQQVANHFSPPPTVTFKETTDSISKNNINQRSSSINASSSSTFTNSNINNNIPPPPKQAPSALKKTSRNSNNNGELQINTNFGNTNFNNNYSNNNVPIIRPTPILREAPAAALRSVLKNATIENTNISCCSASSNEDTFTNLQESSSVLSSPERLANQQIEATTGTNLRVIIPESPSSTNSSSSVELNSVLPRPHISGPLSPPPPPTPPPHFPFSDNITQPSEEVQSVENVQLAENNVRVEVEDITQSTEQAAQTLNFENSMNDDGENIDISNSANINANNNNASTNSSTINRNSNQNSDQNKNSSFNRYSNSASRNPQLFQNTHTVSNQTQNSSQTSSLRNQTVQVQFDQTNPLPQRVEIYDDSVSQDTVIQNQYNRSQYRLGAGDSRNFSYNRREIHYDCNATDSGGPTTPYSVRSPDNLHSPTRSGRASCDELIVVADSDSRSQSNLNMQNNSQILSDQSIENTENFGRDNNDNAEFENSGNWVQNSVRFGESQGHENQMENEDFHDSVQNNPQNNGHNTVQNSVQNNEQNNASRNGQNGAHNTVKNDTNRQNINQNSNNVQNNNRNTQNLNQTSNSNRQNYSNRQNNSTNSRNNRVTLSVDGTRFSVDVKLFHSKPDTLLGRMFKNYSSYDGQITFPVHPLLRADGRGDYHVADGVRANVFQACLEYYTHGRIRCPAHISMREIRESCDYLCIPFSSATISTRNLCGFMHELSNDGAYKLFETFVDKLIVPVMAKAAAYGERECHIVVLNDDDNSALGELNEEVESDEDGHISVNFDIDLNGDLNDGNSSKVTNPQKLGEDNIYVIKSTKMHKFFKYVENKEVAKEVLKERGLKKIRLGIEGYPTSKEEVTRRMGHAGPRTEVIYNYVQRPFIIMSWEQQVGRSKHVDFRTVKRTSMSSLLAAADDGAQTIQIDAISDSNDVNGLNTLDGVNRARRTPSSPVE